MDKKNTMLLTVIAVATLLVAVVGATFAFFTATNEAKGTTTVSATTEKVGAVTVNNPTTAMHIKLNAKEMSVDTKGANYYATLTKEGAADYAATWEYQPISQVSVADSESTTTYNCYYKLNVTAVEVLEAGDAGVKFQLSTPTNVANLAIKTGATDGQGGEAIDVSKEYDLATAQDYTVTFDVTGNMTDVTLIEAAYVLHNLDADQSHFEGEDFNFTATNSGMKCTVAE